MLCEKINPRPQAICTSGRCAPVAPPPGRDCARPTQSPQREQSGRRPRSMGHSRSQPQKTSPLPQKMSRLHGSCGTRLPRGGRAGRVLPAADAVAAKAEGVAIGRTEAEVSRLTRELPFGRTEAEVSRPKPEGVAFRPHRGQKHCTPPHPYQKYLLSLIYYPLSII